MLYQKITVFLLLISFNCVSQGNLEYYLPQNVSFDSSIPTPKEVVGHHVGEWHITHDRLVAYMKALALASPRVTVEETGNTYEGRPQLLLTITSEDNHADISSIKSQHVSITDPSKSGSLDVSSMPVVVWQGYSIHGNESSGSNASMLVAYYYAAAQGKEIEELLSNCVILLDPSFNPDGLTRFSTWANSHKSKNLVADSYNREQNEMWPGGRTNHYWFDLNRDWLPVQHPESQNRVKKFHEWKPNVLTDHHEMGTNATYFFQPGIPSRNNPITPQNTFVLTEKIAEYHAKALDEIGSLYYSKESFDDYYYGKGSTYPDVNGAVGILFEQASSRGHLQESIHGDISFPFTIKNQFTTSLSTTRAASALKDELLQHQKDFYKTALSEAGTDSRKAVIFGAENDPDRSFELAKILSQHEVQIYRLKQDKSYSSKKYPSENSYVVPFNQPQYRLIKAIFEKNTSFQDSLFYDVSAWTFPLAFNLNYEFLSSKQYASALLGAEFKAQPLADEKLEKSDYAYVLGWDQYFSPKYLNHLLKTGFRVKVATEKFSSNGENFNRGSILISVQNQDKSSQDIYTTLEDLVEKGARISPLNTGLTAGVNLGSRTFENIEKPRILMLVEGGISPYDAGEIWHLLDYRFDIELSMVPVRVFNRADLDKYNTLILAHGNYTGISVNAVDNLKRWVKEGGRVVAIKNANKWLKNQSIIGIEMKNNEPDSSGRKPYESIGEYRGAQVTGGTILSANLDTSNPIGFGYEDGSISTFVNGNVYFEDVKNPYSKALVFDSAPLQSGYISEENIEKVKNTPGIIVSKYGRGRIVSFSFNPNFRAFWYGTNKLFLNSVFFGGTINSSAAE
ncbi:MAG: M14 metallopeptidase family protein [Bacteroidota bacterium]